MSAAQASPTASPLLHGLPPLASRGTGCLQGKNPADLQISPVIPELVLAAGRAAGWAVAPRSRPPRCPLWSCHSALMPACCWRTGCRCGMRVHAGVCWGSTARQYGMRLAVVRRDTCPIARPRLQLPLHLTPARTDLCPLSRAVLLAAGAALHAGPPRRHGRSPRVCAAPPARRHAAGGTQLVGRPECAAALADPSALHARFQHVRVPHHGAGTATGALSRLGTRACAAPTASTPG